MPIEVCSVMFRAAIILRMEVGLCGLPGVVLADVTLPEVAVLVVPGVSLRDAMLLGTFVMLGGPLLLALRAFLALEKNDPLFVFDSWSPISFASASVSESSKSDKSAEVSTIEVGKWNGTAPSGALRGGTVSLRRGDVLVLEGAVTPDSSTANPLVILGSSPTLLLRVRPRVGRKGRMGSTASGNAGPLDGPTLSSDGGREATLDRLPMVRDHMGSFLEKCRESRDRGRLGAS